MNSNGDIIGLSVGGWEYENDIYNENKFRHPKSRAAMKLFHETHKKADLFKKYRVQRIFDYKMVSTNPE